MDKVLSVLFCVLFLLVGAVGGFILSPQEEVTKTVEIEVIKEVPTEVEVEILVANANEYLNLAVDDFLEYVDDEELFRCKSHEYNFDEISIARLYDDWNLDFNDEDYTVKFNIKLDYDEDSERSCKKSFDVKAFYEENEDVKVSLIK